MSGAPPLVAAKSGEEYELVVSMPAPVNEHLFAREFGVPLTRVGVVSAPSGPTPRARLRSRDRFVDLPAGHDHFS